MRLAVGLLVAFAVVAVGLAEATAQVAAGRRVALVIGNASYAESPLRNPINDARAMADMLKQRGFDVILRENTSKLDLERVVADFGEKLQQGATGLFYYAGHGMQVNGRNYLIPVDAQIPSEQRVRLEAVDVDVVLEQMQAARSAVNLVILDACRNNPFEKRFRSTGGGLAQINAPEGTLIAYATAPGSVAADGNSRNSLYTEELLKAMQAPGAKVEEVFKAVRVAVSRRSNGAQTPWEASSLTGDFFFVPPLPPKPEPVVVAPPPAPAGPSRAAIEFAFWDAVKASNNAAELQTYLDQFPDGSFAALARARIAALTAPLPAPAPAPAPAGPSRAAMDATFWDSVKGSSNPAELQAYLGQFPEGTFAQLARARIAALTAPALAPQPRAAAPAPSQQMASLPPATAPSPASFDGTYASQVRVSSVGPDAATLTIKDLLITGRAGKDCAIKGQLEPNGSIRELQMSCSDHVMRPTGIIRFKGAFSQDARTGVVAGETTMDYPGWSFHGSRSTWQLASLSPATEPLTPASFDGNYTTEIRLMNVDSSSQTFNLTIKNLRISGSSRASNACTLSGELEPNGVIAQLSLQCGTGGGRLNGRFMRDPATGEIIGQTVVDGPALRANGVRTTWIRLK